MPSAPYEFIALKDKGDLLLGTAGAHLGAECRPGIGVFGAAFGQRTAGLQGEALAWHRSTRHAL